MPPLPDWMNTAGHVAGQVAALPFNILGALAGIRPQGEAGAWKFPERQALALQYIPETLAPEEQAKRLETFRQIPLHSWPTLINHFQVEDQKATAMMQTPEYQQILQQGGPEALRAFGMPPPPQVLAAQDAPLSPESQAQGLGAPSLPNRTRQAILPPIPPEELVKRFNAQDQLAYRSASGPQGEMDRRTMAGVGQTLEQKLAEKRALDAVTSQRDFVPVFGGGAARPGAAGTATPEGQVFDLGNGQFALADGTLVAKPAGPTTPATTEPAPLAGQPMAGRTEEQFPPVDILPGESLSSFEQRKQAREMDMRAALTVQADQRKLVRQRAIQRDKIVAGVQGDQAYMETILKTVESKITEKALPQEKNFGPGPLGIAQDVFYQGTQLTHTKNAYPEQASLMRSVKGILGQIARRYSGEKGVLTEQDVGRVSELLPVETDTRETARIKIKDLRTVTDEIAARRLDPAWKPPAGARLVGPDLQPIEAAASTAPAGAPTAPAGGTVRRLSSGRTILVEP